MATCICRGDDLVCPCVSLVVKAGVQIASYTVIRRLGSGGMGEVFLARHRVLGRMTAIKVLRETVHQSADAIPRFLAEARAAARILHPGIVEILDCDVLDNARAFLVMEYLRGESMRAFMDRQMPAHRDVRFIAATIGLVADALRAAHERKIIHRDLKPDNIFFSLPSPDSEKIQVKVLDFGVAKLLDSEGPGSQTQTGALLGTPMYMSPEQCRGARDLDERSDIYSLGCVAYELVAGHVPFSADSVVMMLMAHNANALPSLAKAAPATPTQLVNLIESMLAKNPDDRPQSMDAVVHAIAEFLGCDATELSQRLVVPDGFPVTSFEPAIEPPGSEDPTAHGSLQPMATDAQRSPRTFWGRGGKRWAATTALFLAAIVTLVGVTLWLARRPGNNDSASKTYKSIAVLPFDAGGEDKSAQYLGDGISEELISLLTQIPQLRVVARATSFRFRGRELNLKEVGERLNAEVLLEGSVARHEGKLKVNVSAVEAATGFNIWSRTFEKPLGDIFALQRAIAEDVAQQTGAGQHAALTTNYETRNTQSYDAFLKGRFHFYRRTGADLALAVDYFKQASQDDSTAAEPLAWLSQSYSLLSYYSSLTPKEAFELALDAADRALRLNPESPSAIAAKAFAIYFYLWDFPRADAMFRKAKALDPLNPQIHHWHALVQFALGDGKAYVDSIARARDLDPMSSIYNTDVGESLLLNARSKEGLRTIEMVVEMDPGFARGHFVLGLYRLERKMVDKALSEFRRALELTQGKNTYYRAMVGYTLAVANQTTEAREILAEFRHPATGAPAAAFDQALVAYGLGELDVFFDLLEQAFIERSRHLPFWLENLWIFDPIRTDQRYRDLIERMKTLHTKTTSD